MIEEGRMLSCQTVVILFSGRPTMSSTYFTIYSFIHAAAATFTQIFLVFFLVEHVLD